MPQMVNVGFRLAQPNLTTTNSQAELNHAWCQHEDSLPMSHLRFRHRANDGDGRDDAKCAGKVQL